MSDTEDGKRQPEPLDLPDTVDFTAVNEAGIALVRLVCQRRIGARQALYISRMLEHRRKAIGDATLEEEMRLAEERNRQARGEEP